MRFRAIDPRKNELRTINIDVDGTKMRKSSQIIFSPSQVSDSFRAPIRFTKKIKGITFLITHIGRTDVGLPEIDSTESKLSIVVKKNE